MFKGDTVVNLSALWTEVPDQMRWREATVLPLLRWRKVGAVCLRVPLFQVDRRFSEGAFLGSRLEGQPSFDTSFSPENHALGEF